MNFTNKEKISIPIIPSKNREFLDQGSAEFKCHDEVKTKYYQQIKHKLVQQIANIDKACNERTDPYLYQ